MLDLSVAAKRGEHAGAKSADGNALSYPEAMVLYEYLAQTCGADAVIGAFLEGASPEGALNLSYAELFAAAKADYAARYGEYIS